MVAYLFILIELKMLTICYLTIIVLMMIVLLASGLINMLPTKEEVRDHSTKKISNLSTADTIPMED